MAATTPQSGVTFALSDQAYALGVSQCNDPNSYFTGSICACRPGYYQISGKCTQCPFASYYNGFDCIDIRTGLPVGQNAATSQISFNVNGDIQVFGQSKTVGVTVQSSTQQSNQQVISTASVNGIIQNGILQNGIQQQTINQAPFLQQQMVLPPGAIPHNTIINENQGNNNIQSASLSSLNQNQGGIVGFANNLQNSLSTNTQQNGNSGLLNTAGTIPHGAYLSDGTNVAQGLSQTALNNFQSQGFSQANFGIDSYFDNSRGVLGRSQSSLSPNSLQYFLASLFGSISSGSVTSFSTSSNDPSFFFPAGMIPFGSSSFSELTQSSFFSAQGYCPVNEYLSAGNICVCIPGYERNS